MYLRFVGLAAHAFSPLFQLSSNALEERGIRRMTVDEKPGFPCRVTLEDAEAGESVLLLPFEHQPAPSPYRSSGPIFVREAVSRQFDGAELPPVFAGRLLSARAYSADGMMLDADVAESGDIVAVLDRQFGRAETTYAHVHFARRGCFACRVERG